MVEHFSGQYDSPAYMKLINAGKHFEALEREIIDWGENNPLMAPARAPGGGRGLYELFRPETPVVPLLAWSGRFGDGVHNLRAALDLLAYELCHIDGGFPAKPRKVYFPVVENEENWAEKIEHLGSIPSSLLERVRDVQPWHSTAPQKHALTLLTALDNMDKHRSTVGLMILPGRLDPPRLHPLPEKDEALWQEPWMQFGMNPPLPQGVLPALWHVDPAPMVYFENRMTFLGHLQRWLFHETNRAFGYIATGEWPTLQHPAPEPEWADLP